MDIKTLIGDVTGISTWRVYLAIGSICLAIGLYGGYHLHTLQDDASIVSMLQTQRNEAYKQLEESKKREDAAVKEKALLNSQLSKVRDDISKIPVFTKCVLPSKQLRDYNLKVSATAN